MKCEARRTLFFVSIALMPTPCVGDHLFQVGAMMRFASQLFCAPLAKVHQPFRDAQIMAILKQAEGGVPVSELCRDHGMSSASFYKWRAKFGGMDASLIAEMKDMAEQNRRLKKMYAEMSMQNELLNYPITTTATECKYGIACRCLAQDILGQHRKSTDPLPHVSDTASQIYTNPTSRANHAAFKIWMSLSSLLGQISTENLKR